MRCSRAIWGALLYYYGSEQRNLDAYIRDSYANFNRRDTYKTILISFNIFGFYILNIEFSYIVEFYIPWILSVKIKIIIESCQKWLP